MDNWDGTSIGIYYNTFIVIDNHNRISQSDLVLYKYWVTYHGYFILATTLALGTGITDGELLFCHGISE